MKKMLALLAGVAMMSLSAAAQAPVAELGGGYTFRSFDAPTSSSTMTQIHTNGWFASIEFNANRWIGISTDFDFTRVNLSNSTTTLFPGSNDFSSVMVGPQIFPLGHGRIQPFGKIQVGLAHYANSEPQSTGCNTSSEGGFNSCTLTDGSFAFSAGGGLDIKLLPYLKVRLAEFDFEQTRLFEPADTGLGNQNNYKLKAGVIIGFGGR